MMAFSIQPYMTALSSVMSVACSSRYCLHTSASPAVQKAAQAYSCTVGKLPDVSPLFSLYKTDMHLKRHKSMSQYVKRVSLVAGS
jgi:hypothetical protein